MPVRLAPSRSREAGDSVLANRAGGTRDIEGKVTRVGASELGCKRVSKPSAPAMLAASLLRLFQRSTLNLLKLSSALISVFLGCGWRVPPKKSRRDFADLPIFPNDHG